MVVAMNLDVPLAIMAYTMSLERVRWCAAVDDSEDPSQFENCSRCAFKVS